MKKRGIVREPPSSFCNCITDYPDRDKINVDLAKAQHRAYCETLTNLGIDIGYLPTLDKYPDSCFVEDTAIIHGERALIARLAKTSRQGEEVALKETLEVSHNIGLVRAPGTIEGGDVIHLQDQLIVGKTLRTNKHGIEQLSEWLDVEVVVIDKPDIVHLKSYMTALSDTTLLITQELSRLTELEDFEKIIVPEDERYAANTLTIGKTVLMAKGYEKTIQLVHDAGFSVIILETSEFQKCEGALTCLSILY